MFWVELIIVLAMIFLGTRKGGPFLALAGGLGMLIMTFVLFRSAVALCALIKRKAL